MKKVNELFDVKEDFKILSIHSDSRYVGKDSVFFCIEGRTTDGHRYADDAVFQGAKVVVYKKALKRKYPGVIYIEVNDVLDELNRVSDLFYDHPSYKLTAIGITGTSGKTVTAITIRDVLSHYLKMGYIGNNDAQFGNTIIQSSFTTPEPIFLHRTLNEMVKSNVKGVTIEVSSHGLSLKRVNSINFDIAVFTNLHEEHLDFHGTTENLMHAKMKLFELVDEKGYIVLNADEVRFNHYLNQNGNIKAKRITYGIDRKADLMARNVQLFVDHSEFDLYIGEFAYHINVPLIGKFNVSNTLAVLGVLLALELRVEEVIGAIDYIKMVDGRMERLETSLPFNIIVDYCHYRHSYEEVLTFANEVKQNGRIIAVLGVPSKKVAPKRKKISSLLDKYCDEVILTQEEIDEEIYETTLSMQEEIVNAKSIIINDRKIAIRQAIELACKDDIILILGKGHEQFMKTSVGHTPYPGDKYIALKAIEEIFERRENDEI